MITHRLIVDWQPRSLGGFVTAGHSLGNATASYVIDALGERVRAHVNLASVNPPNSNRSVHSGHRHLPEYCLGKDVILKIAAGYGTDVAVCKSIEVLGPVASQLSLGSRFTMANMGVELGAKCAIFEAGAKTEEFLAMNRKRQPRLVSPDTDAEHEAVNTVDCTGVEPMVALPHDPSNSHPVSEVEPERLRVDQAFLGSCTNARMEDIAVAAHILDGRTVHPDVRMIVTPASSKVWHECAKLGCWETLSAAGAMITSPGCGACAGGHLGLIGDGERAISSTNRNFQGRMGSADAGICLASPATVAASAVKGYIADPREFL